MKKLTTKQLAIALLAIAFAFIIGLTTYRGVTGQFKSTPAVTVQTKKTKKKKTASVKKEEKKETTSQTSSKLETKDTNNQDTNKTDASTSEKKETKQATTPSQTDTSNKQTTTPSKTETKKNTSNTTTTPPKQTTSPSQNTPVKQTVSVRVIGINETMMSGDIEVNSSSTAYSVLRQLAKENNKPVTTKGFGSTVYVSGIDGLKEFDHGPSSGWMYKVNGTPPNIGSGAYSVKAGDTVIWYYVNVEK